jgi:hypothetical protein
MLNECDSKDQEDFLHNSSGKIQEEEFCRILDLRKNLQFSDVLIQHMSHYLSLGWHLAAINAQDRVNQSLDFQASKATWSEKLIELSLDGVELNVGVRTGSSSGLLVIEVHKQGRVFPFRRGDWSSECVAEAEPNWSSIIMNFPRAGNSLPLLHWNPLRSRCLVKETW